MRANITQLTRKRNIRFRTTIATSSDHASSSERRGAIRPCSAASGRV